MYYELKTFFMRIFRNTLTFSIFSFFLCSILFSVVVIDSPSVFSQEHTSSRENVFSFSLSQMQDEEETTQAQSLKIHPSTNEEVHLAVFYISDDDLGIAHK